MSKPANRNILISGASGMIGGALSDYLCERGFTVYSLRRDTTNAPFYFDATARRVHLDASIPLFAAINLAGPSIADRRWSDVRKRELLESRVQLTEALAVALAESEQPVPCFLSASAIGYYGATGNETRDEDSPGGSDFLAQIARAWEAATSHAEEAGINTVHLRFGIVLSPRGGVLKKLLLPFKMGLGGRIGDGQQAMSWISIADVVAIVHKLLLDNPPCGPINLVARQPISNAEFSALLAGSLHRPNVLPLPELMVKLLFGEMGEALLLGSSRVTSNKLAKLGIELQHPTLPAALEALLS